MASSTKGLGFIFSRVCGYFGCIKAIIIALLLALMVNNLRILTTATAAIVYEKFVLHGRNEFSTSL